MYRQKSQYARHPRITWFGPGGTVAYVDYTGATSSYFVGISDVYEEEFMIIPPDNDPDRIMHGFDSMDKAIEHALEMAG